MNSFAMPKHEEEASPLTPYKQSIEASESPRFILKFPSPSRKSHFRISPAKNRASPIVICGDDDIPSIENSSVLAKQITPLTHF